MRILVLATGLALALTGAASAQSSTHTGSAGTTNAASSSGTQNPAAIRQQIQTDLSQAGFTDIKMMPESFLVRAKDKRGNPVMMVINPDSVTASTEIPGQGKQTTGKGQ